MTLKIKYSLVLAALMLALSGCSKPEPELKPGSQTSEPAAPAVLNTTPIKIGDVMSYTDNPVWSNLVQHGWQLALEQTNESGGVLGRPVEVISRDAKNGQGNAALAMRELIEREQIDLFIGALFSHVGLELSQVAKRENVLLMATWAGSSKLLWADGHQNVFRIQPPSYFYGQMFAEAVANTNTKRWVTIAPNFEAGHAFVSDFKSALSEMSPEVQWVGEHWPAVGKLDAGATVQAIKLAKPDAIFNCLFGGDANTFIREGRLRGLFDAVDVVDCFAGLPENWGSLGETLPEGWLTIGLPVAGDETTEFLKFITDYEARWNERPGLGSWFGYLALSSVLQAIEAAGSTDLPKVRKALQTQIFSTPNGPLHFRSVDQQSSVGLWLGRTTLVDGKPAFEDAVYKLGDQYYPADEVIINLRSGASE